MSKKKVEEIIFDMVKPVIDTLLYELVDVEFVREGAGWYLRIYIDKPGGINLDDCQIVSENVSEKLDKEDPIEQAYFLEISSPGLERPLKTPRDFEKYTGEDVEVKLFKPQNGKKIIIGKLLGLIDNKIKIQEDKDVLEFDKTMVSRVRRHLKF